MIYYCFGLLLPIFHLIGAKLDISLYDSEMLSDKENFIEGEVVGFADYNGDHFTDIFYLTEAGSQLNVKLLSNQPKHEKLVLAQLDNDLIKSGYKIRSVVLSDFAGASMLDVVILLSLDANGPYDAYHSKHIVNSKPQITLNSKDRFATFRQQPLVLFYNNDDMPVLLAVASTDNLWKIWKKEDNEFVVDAAIEQLNAQILLDTIKRPIYSLFFDVDMDYSSDVMLTDYAEMSFKFYRRLPRSYFIDFNQPYKIIMFPTDAKELAQPVVADFLRKNFFGLLLAYCTETECSDGSTKLAVYDLKNGDNWVEVDIQGDFRMTVNNENDAAATRPLVASLRTVDLNLDGYPDVVTTLLDKNDESVIGVLVNECNQNKLEFKVKLFEDKYAFEVIPFDFMEDGFPDLLVSREYVMEMYKTNFYESNYDNAKFLKISVMSGRCNMTDCDKLSALSTHVSITYGSPINGASFSLKAIDASGDEISMRGHLISSTSYLALQLPFHLFGLSMNIDKLQSVIVATATGWPSIGKLSTVRFRTHVITNPFFSSYQLKWLSTTYKITPVKNWSKNGFSFVNIILIFVATLFVVFLILLSYRYAKLRRRIFAVEKYVDEITTFE